MIISYVLIIVLSGSNPIIKKEYSNIDTCNTAKIEYINKHSEFTIVYCAKNKNILIGELF